MNIENHRTIFNWEEIEFYGNEKMLNQLWINLIDNVIKFSPSHTRINVDINKKPEAMVTHEGMVLSLAKIT